MLDISSKILKVRTGFLFVLKAAVLVINIFIINTAYSYTDSTRFYWWTELFNGVNGEINSITEYQGKIVVAGDFNEINGQSYNNIAVWNGSNWDKFDGGVNGEIFAMVVFEGDLIIGGAFSVAGSDSAHKIARWNGSSWVNMGSNFNRPGERVKSLTIYNNKLYVGGVLKFDELTGAGNIAKWTGNSWVTLGEGLDGEVNTLITYNGDLIAGGEFTNSGFDQLKYIGRWTGGSWKAMDGIGAPVYSLAKYKGILYAGGDFAGKVAYRQGGDWHVPGGGVESRVNALISFNGYLVAGGSFNYAGSPDDSLYVNKVVLWDENDWSELGTGMDKEIKTFYIYETDKLVAGGSFSIAGGDSASGIALWDTLETYSISGNVRYSEGGTVQSGVIRAVKYDYYTRGIIVLDSTRIQPDGSFSLKKVPNLPCRIIGYPDDELDFIPMYYPSTIYWENSTIIIPSESRNSIDMTVEKINNEHFPGSIAGRVNLDYLPLGYSTTDNLEINSGAIVYVKLGDSFMNFALTDRFERYKIPYLQEGTYVVIVNRLGFSTAFNYSVNLNYAQGYELDSINFTLIKSDGGFISGIGNGNILTPGGFNLYQNYPNPFNPSTDIKFELPASSSVSLVIYNALGQSVATLLSNKSLTEGSYTLEFNADVLPSGVYFYRIEATGTGNLNEAFSDTKKMILLK